MQAIACLPSLKTRGVLRALTVCRRTDPQPRIRNALMDPAGNDLFCAVLFSFCIFARPTVPSPLVSCAANELGSKTVARRSVFVRSRGLRDQCKAAQVAFFFKQWGGIRPKSGGRPIQKSNAWLSIFLPSVIESVCLEGSPATRTSR
jgi:hypothetical protein